MRFFIYITLTHIMGLFGMATSQCSECPAGFVAKILCSTTADTQCFPCPRGTFNTQPSTQAVCTPCTPCPLEHYQVEVCTDKTDTFCQSCSVEPEGYNYDYLRRCLLRMEENTSNNNTNNTDLFGEGSGEGSGDMQVDSLGKVFAIFEDQLTTTEAFELTTEDDGSGDIGILIIDDEFTTEEPRNATQSPEKDTTTDALLYIETSTQYPKETSTHGPLPSDHKLNDRYSNDTTSGPETATQTQQEATNETLLLAGGDLSDTDAISTQTPSPSPSTSELPSHTSLLEDEDLLPAVTIAEPDSHEPEHHATVGPEEPTTEEDDWFISDISKVKVVDTGNTPPEEEEEEELHTIILGTTPGEVVPLQDEEEEKERSFLWLVLIGIVAAALLLWIVMAVFICTRRKRARSKQTYHVAAPNHFDMPKAYPDETKVKPLIAETTEPLLRAHRPKPSPKLAERTDGTQPQKYTLLNEVDPDSKDPANLTPSKKRRPFGASIEFDFMDDASENELDKRPPSIYNPEYKSPHTESLRNLLNRFLSFSDINKNGSILNGEEGGDRESALSSDGDSPVRQNGGTHDINGLGSKG